MWLDIFHTIVLYQFVRINDTINVSARQDYHRCSERFMEQKVCGGNEARGLL